MKTPAHKKSKSFRGRESTASISNHHDIAYNTSKPSAVYTPTGGRSHTVTVALPGSIIANAQSLEQKTLLAGAIARALAVFCVDEVVIFDDDELHTSSDEDISSNEADYGLGNYGRNQGYTAHSDPSHFLTHLLSYLETPPYLRKHLFPMHPNLRTAGLLPSLDMPHHLRANEWCDYREGIVISAAGRRRNQWNQPHSRTKRNNKKRSYSESSEDESNNFFQTGNTFGHPPAVVDMGLSQTITIPDIGLAERTRVTVRLNRNGAQPVHTSTPRAEAGYYWGYYVRRSRSISAVFTECPFDGGYDLSFGTSERGAPFHRVVQESSESLPRYKHMLIAFGGVAGIEAAIRNDTLLQEMRVRPTEADKLFDYWVNFLPGQGSRTIRTEEAVWLGLMGLRGLAEKKE